MKKLVFCVLCVMSWVGASATEKLAPALEEISKFVGGKWKGTVKSPEEDMAVEFSYFWHPDKKGLMSQGVIGKDAKNAVHVHAMFGWDALAKKVYYLDTHNSDNVMYGHVELEKDDMVFTFGPAGGDPKKWSSRGRFLDKDTYQFVIRQADGKEVVGLTLKREKA